MIAELRRWYRRIGFRFDALAAKLLCEQFGVDLDSMDKIPKEEYIAAWVWNAHKSYSMYRYKKPVYSYAKMKKFIALMPKSEWDEKILPAMYASSPPDEEGSKKKHMAEAPDRRVADRDSRGHDAKDELRTDLQGVQRGQAKE